MTGLRELVEGVYDVQLGGTTRDGRTMYVGAFVLTNGPTTLVDTGWPDTTDELLSALADGVDELDRVFVTHDGHDHWGGLDAVCDRYDPQVFVPAETDLPATLNTDPDVRFADGDTFAGGVEVVRTPGHTTAASSLYLRDQRALIAADSLDGSDRRGLPPGYLLPPPARYNDDHEAAETNLERLLEYDIDSVFVFHGSHVVGDAGEKLERLVAFKDHYQRPSGVVRAGEAAKSDCGDGSRTRRR